MNDNSIMACIQFAKSQRLACADEAAAELARLQAVEQEHKAQLMDARAALHSLGRRFDLIGCGRSKNLAGTGRIQHSKPHKAAVQGFMS